MVLGRLLNASHALLVSISKLKDMVERQRLSFQLFLEAKLLRHQVEMEQMVDELRGEIRTVGVRLAALEITGNGNPQKTMVEEGPNATIGGKRTRRLRGDDTNANNCC